MMKMCAFAFTWLLLLTASVLTEGVRVVDPETAPKQQPFDSTQCYYCNQASQWIYGLSKGFPSFDNDEQKYVDFVNTVQSLVCDIDNDPDVCMTTIAKVSTTAYHNWVASCTAQEFLDKITKTLEKIACFEFPEICETVEVFGELIDFCLAVGVLKYCPSPMSPCDICTQYYSCPKDNSCKFAQALSCNGL